jgi:hypothetical protein
MITNYFFSQFLSWLLNIKYDKPNLSGEYVQNITVLAPREFTMKYKVI